MQGENRIEAKGKGRPRIEENCPRAASIALLLPSDSTKLLLFFHAGKFHDGRNDHQEQIVKFLRLIRIVLSAFFGVRKRASHEADFANVNLVALPFVAVFLALCIGGILFGVVHLIAHSTSTMQGL
ncbi:DUF2970 domain-containing protein [Burkholderia sp. lig30]|jgi:hypothetical protein|uniref:DUF2970 domain-containing protein n=1 Tax=Burkholderia sp. lig30 TaxID=1192124 RepID=UPI003FA4711E